MMGHLPYSLFMVVTANENLSARQKSCSCDAYSLTKTEGWKMKFPFGMVLFTRVLLNFRESGVQMQKEQNYRWWFQKKWKHMSQIGSFSLVKVKIKTI